MLEGSPPPGPIGARRMTSPRLNVLFLAAVGVATVAPLLVVDLPPLHDYPNHLARVYVLAHLDESPLLARYYEARWEVLPNLAMDLLLPPLLRFLTPETAGKLFCGLILVSTVPAVGLLHFALFGRVSPWPAAAALFAYNYVFIFGFLNYLLGVNLALTGVALWILLRNKPLAAVMVFGGLYSTLLFFAHLYALGLYAVVVCGFELRRWRKAKSGRGGFEAMRLPATFVQFLAPLGLLVAAMPSLPASARELSGWSVWAKIDGLYSVFDSGNPSQDGVFLLLLALGLAALATLGRFRVADGMRLPLLLLGGCFLLMPGLLFGSGYADYRMPLAALLFAIAGADWTPSRRGSRRALFLLVAVLLSARTALISRAWAETRAEYDAAEQAITNLPEGSRVLGYLITGEPRFGNQPPLEHVVTLAVIRKSAFVPSLFAFPGKHPLRLRPAYQEIADQTPHPAVVNSGISEPPDSASHPLRSRVGGLYDYLLVFARDPESLDLPKFYRDVFVGKHVRLLKVTDPRVPHAPSASRRHSLSFSRFFFSH